MVLPFSIITINFNNLEGLRKTVESVIQQTFTDYEYIVIDGGSTDGSRELIEQYRNRFSYWCSEPDKGIYNAMNKGIIKANGEHLLFLNSGDVLYDNYVLEQVANIGCHADMVSGQVLRMDNGALLRRYDSSLFFQLYKDTLNHQGTFIKRTLFEKNRYDENLKIVSDWKFWIDSIIFNKATVDIIDVVVAKQEMNGISSNGLLLKEERTKLLNEYFPPLLQKELEDYSRIRKSIYYKRIVYLKENSVFLYNLIRRILAVFVRLV